MKADFRRKKLDFGINIGTIVLSMFLTLEVMVLR
jgi:hypothetical protein